MLHTVRRVRKVSKLQFFVVVAGLLIASSALYHFSLGSQGGSNNNFSSSSTHVLAATTGPVPGLVLIWGNSNEEPTVQNNSWLHAGQIVFNWGSAEPTQGSFPNWTGSGNSLSSQLAQYYAAGKTATVQVNADSMPNWLVNTNGASGSGGNGLVDSCGTRGLQYTQANPIVPAYWHNAGADGLNPAYETAMQNMLNSLATAINNSPYKSAVLGVRTGFDLIGTEHYLDDSSVTLYSPLPAGCNGWNGTVANEAAAKVMYINYQAFEPLGIHPFLRTEVISNSGPGQYFNSTYFPAGETSYLSPSKAWIFQTSADPDTGGNTNSIWVNYIKTGITTGYAEQLLAAQGQNGKVVNDALSWEWWRELMDLSRGTSYIATYNADLTNSTLATKFFNQTFFQNFVNTYAGTNNTKAEANSPGTWIAFAPSSSPFGGNLGLFMTESSSTNTTGYDSNLGSNILGPGQPYGRYATKINPGGSLSASLDSAYPKSGSATIKVWYYDSGSGSWTINGGSVNQTVNKGGSGSWQTATFNSSSVPSVISLSVPANAASGTDFHMIEMVKGGAVPTCSANPTVSLTAPLSGATVSGTAVALAANATAAANCTLAQVGFSVNSTSIASITHAPYAATWDSTTVANSSYTITATATDTSGHSASSSITITVDNTNSNPGGGGGPGPGGGSGGIPVVGSGGSVTITPNTTTQISGTVTLTPTMSITTNGSVDYVIKTVYYLDGKLLATETKAPYSYHLNTTDYLNGTYTLTVRTYYASGATTVSTQKLVIDNPFSFKQLGLLFIHYAIPLTVTLVVLLAVLGFLFWWVRFHSPGGKVAIALTTMKNSVASIIRRHFHNVPPWKRPGGGLSSESGDAGSSEGGIPTSSNPIDSIPNANVPMPGEVVGPERSTNTEK